MEGYPELTADNWAGAVRYDDGTSMVKNREYDPFENANYLTRDAGQAYLEVLDHAGVTVPRRDTVDKRVIEDVRTGSATFGNGIIDRVEQAGGWPELLTYDVPPDSDEDGMPDEWEISEGLDINDPSDRFGIKEGEVYDNLERYLNELASDKPYLLPPVNLEAIVQNDTEVTLSWQDITDDELAFVIQRTDAEGKFIVVDTVEADVVQYTDVPPGPDRTVVYRVFGIGDELTSVPSREASIILMTGIKGTPHLEHVSVHPNPFEGPFNLLFEASCEGRMDIRIFNITGSTVMEKATSFHAGKVVIPIDLEDIPEGVYFLKYKSEEGKVGCIKTIRN